ADRPFPLRRRGTPRPARRRHLPVRPQDRRSTARRPGRLDGHRPDPPHREAPRAARAHRPALHRVELPGARQGERVGDPGQPDAVHQGVERAERPVRPRPDPAAQRRDRLRGRAVRRDRQDGQAREQGRRAEPRARVHVRQRRVGPRLAAAQETERRAVRPRQELRRVLPARPVPRHARRGPEPQRPAAEDDPERPGHAGPHDRRHDLRRPDADRVAQQHDDAPPRRGHPDRHPARRRLRPHPAGVDEARRHGGDRDREDRPAGEPGHGRV
ncbi:MAG: Fumarylacetoacetate hydrolase family protein, partial [uncultured Phycisphaerae bacterium]